jgi:hypothetical protein
LGWGAGPVRNSPTPNQRDSLPGHDRQTEGLSRRCPIVETSLNRTQQTVARLGTMNFLARSLLRRCIAVLGLVFAISSGATGGTARADLKGAAPSISVVERREILKVLCEGNVKGQTCGVCPSYSSPQDSDGLSPRVGPYLLGMFVEPKAKEAYVSLYGCDYRFAAYTGAVLLRKTNAIWKVVRYDESTDARNCFRFPYKTGTTVLACYGNGGGQGYFVEAIYALYIGPEKTTSKPILSVQSNEAACQSTLDEVSFRSWRRADLNADSQGDLELVVTEAHAKANAESCESSRSGPTVRHRIAVLFDGTRFTVSPKSLATATCLDSNELGGEAPTTYCPKIAA